MRDIDQTIDQALAAEERDLLRRIGDDPGHIEQTLSLLSGRTGWVSGVIMAVQALAFLAAIWTGWQFFTAEDALSAVRWGLPSAVLFLIALMLKLALWPVMHFNRLHLAIKRLELLVVNERGDVL